MAEPDPKLDQLFRDVLLSPPDEADLERIHARLMRSVRERTAASPRRSWWIAAPALAAVFALALMIHRERPGPGSDWVAAPCAAVPIRLASAEDSQLVLVGPGAARSLLDGIALRAGQLVAHSGKRPLALDAPGVHVVLARDSTVEIAVERSYVRVAAYHGEATVHLLVSDQTISLRDGHAVTSTGEATPAGLRGEVTRWLSDGADSVVCASPPAAPATAQGDPPPAPRPIVPRGSRAPVAAPIIVAQAEQMQAVEPAEPAPAKEPATPALLLESRQLAEALSRLHAGDAATALRIIEDNPWGELGAEADRTRIEALIVLGQHARALSLLDGWPAARMQEDVELSVTRGELRAEVGRFAEALGDFYSSYDRAKGSLAARSLAGRSVCRNRLGDEPGARQDAADYLRRFPSGAAVGEMERLARPDNR